MALADDVQAHADSIAATVAGVIAAKIADYPQRYSKNELGRVLVDDIQIATREAAGAEDFTDLDV